MNIEIRTHDHPHRLGENATDSIEPRCDAPAGLQSVLFLLAGMGQSQRLWPSMGVRMVIANARAQRARGHKRVLFGARPVVQSTLERVALDPIIPIVADRDQALARLA